MDYNFKDITRGLVTIPEGLLPYLEKMSFLCRQKQRLGNTFQSQMIQEFPEGIIIIQRFGNQERLTFNPTKEEVPKEGLWSTQDFTFFIYEFRTHTHQGGHYAFSAGELDNPLYYSYYTPAYILTGGNQCVLNIGRTQLQGISNILDWWYIGWGPWVDGLFLASNLNWNGEFWPWGGTGTIIKRKSKNVAIVSLISTQYFLPDPTSPPNQLPLGPYFANIYYGIGTGKTEGDAIKSAIDQAFSGMMNGQYMQDGITHHAKIPTLSTDVPDNIGHPSSDWIHPSIDGQCNLVNTQVGYSINDTIGPHWQYYARYPNPAEKGIEGKGQFDKIKYFPDNQFISYIKNTKLFEADLKEQLLIKEMI